MARKPRIEFAGAFYHVVARGNHRQAIFRNDEDRTAYLDRLERYRAARMMHRAPSGERRDHFLLIVNDLPAETPEE